MLAVPRGSCKCLLAAAPTRRMPHPPCASIVSEGAAPVNTEHAKTCSLGSAEPCTPTYKVCARGLGAIAEGVDTWNGGAATCCADRAQIASGMYRDSSCQLHRRDVRSFHTCCRTRLRLVMGRKANLEAENGPTTFETATTCRAVPVRVHRSEALRCPVRCVRSEATAVSLKPFLAQGHFPTPLRSAAAFCCTLICTQGRVARASSGSGDSQCTAVSLRLGRCSAAFWLLWLPLAVWVFGNISDRVS